MAITSVEVEAQINAHRTRLREREDVLRREPLTNGRRRDVIREIRELESRLAYWERELQRLTIA